MLHLRTALRRRVSSVFFARSTPFEHQQRSSASSLAYAIYGVKGEALYRAQMHAASLGEVARARKVAGATYHVSHYGKYNGESVKEEPEFVLVAASEAKTRQRVQAAVDSITSSLVSVESKIHHIVNELALLESSTARMAKELARFQSQAEDAEEEEQVQSWQKMLYPSFRRDLLIRAVAKFRKCAARTVHDEYALAETPDWAKEARTKAAPKLLEEDLDLMFIKPGPVDDITIFGAFCKVTPADHAEAVQTAKGQPYHASLCRVFRYVYGYEAE